MDIANMDVKGQEKRVEVCILVSHKVWFELDLTSHQHRKVIRRRAPRFSLTRLTSRAGESNRSVSQKV